MSRQWTPIIHREYNNSLRQVVADNDRYQLGVAIWDQLINVEAPTVDAAPVPHRPGRFTITIMGYVVSFEMPLDADGKVREDATEIKLLPITKAQ